MRTLLKKLCVQVFFAVRKGACRAQLVPLKLFLLTKPQVFGRVFDASMDMNRRRLFVLLATVFLSHTLPAQEMAFRKGSITDAVQVGDTIPETFALYLPPDFETSANWPALFVFDMKGRGSQALGMFREAADANGYLLVASNNIHDSLSIADNILVTSRMINRVYSLFPVQKQRMYTAGFGTGAQMAALVPSFIKEISGVVSMGSDIPNTEILNEKSPFYYLGIAGRGDFVYADMSKTLDLLRRRKYPNNLLVFEGGREWPGREYLTIALELLTMDAMGQGKVSKDRELMVGSYQRLMQQVERLITSRRLLGAYNLMEEVSAVFAGTLELDSLRDKMKLLKKDKLYRSQKREENSVLLREALIREDYLYYLEEDILTYNFDNLGWWNFQMGELAKYQKSGKLAERYMGQRLEGYLNALVEDNIDMLLQATGVDEEALLFLWMLKTITAPKEYANYLKIISMSSKYEDYGTALFYLEELLKNGYEEKAGLYQLEHTALLRITPEYNAIIEEYLKDARYEIIPEE